MGFLLIICTCLFVLLILATGIFRKDINDNRTLLHRRTNHQGTTLKTNRWSSSTCVNGRRSIHELQLMGMQLDPAGVTGKYHVNDRKVFF